MIGIRREKFLAQFSFFNTRRKNYELQNPFCLSQMEAWLLLAIWLIINVLTLLMRIRPAELVSKCSCLFLSK